MRRLTPEEIEKRKSDRQKDELWSVIKKFFFMFLISAATKDRSKSRRR
jgi:hypothetical protein